LTETIPAVGEPVESRPYTYDHVPMLRELLTHTRGQPGCEYAQVAVQNGRRAQDEGWGPLVGGAAIYTIEGPKGSVDCTLLGRGKPIRGQAYNGGARVCLVDSQIYELTGFLDPTIEPTPRASLPPVGKSEDKDKT
jgi:hypothetical protein